MNDQEKINEDKIPHKCKKLCSYPAKMKVEAVRYAETNDNTAT